MGKVCHRIKGPQHAAAQEHERNVQSSIESIWGANVKPIPISDKMYLEDPRKWLDANLKPTWEN